MRRALRWVTISATLMHVLALSACGLADPAPPASVPTLGLSPTTAPQPSPATRSSPVSNSTPPAGSPADPAAQTAVVEAVMRDAAGRLSLASGAGDLHLQQVEAREWPDASLGCPSQGVMYAQVVTPGYRVVVSGAGRELEYHADSRGRFVLCQQV